MPTTAHRSLWYRERTHFNAFEPNFTDKMSINKVSIEQFNSNVQKTFGTTKTAAIKKKTNGSKPFHCPRCKVKSSNVSDLKMHVKTSHSLKVVKQKSRKEVTQILKGTHPSF